MREVLITHQYYAAHLPTFSVFLCCTPSYLGFKFLRINENKFEVIFDATWTSVAYLVQL